MKSIVPQPCPSPADLANKLSHQNGNSNLQAGPPQLDKQICAEKMKASAAAVPERSSKVPDPPRRADGRVDWDKVSDELLMDLLERFSRSRIAASWGISRATLFLEIRKRRAKEQGGGAAGNNMFGWRPRQYQRPRPLKLFELLWTMPATHIARDFECSQATILGWAKEDGLKGPGHRYWQRKKNGIKVEVPANAKAFYMALRAQAAPEETLGEIPEVFRTSEIESKAGSSQSDKLSDTSAEQGASAKSEADGAKPLIEPSNPRGRGRQRIPLNLTPAEFLAELWLNPTTRLAEKYEMAPSTILQKARECGLGPYRPPEGYWRNRKSGDPLTIPEHIQKVIARLRAESDRTRGALAASGTASTRELSAPAPQTSSALPMVGSPQLPGEPGPGPASVSSAKPAPPSPSANA